MWIVKCLHDGPTNGQTRPVFEVRRRSWKDLKAISLMQYLALSLANRGLASKVARANVEYTNWLTWMMFVNVTSTVQPVVIVAQISTSVVKIWVYRLEDRFSSAEVFRIGQVRNNYILSTILVQSVDAWNWGNSAFLEQSLKICKQVFIVR